MGKKWGIRRLVVLSFAISFGLLTVSTPAFADPWPSGCDWGMSGLYTTYAKCTKGPGFYRAVAKYANNTYAYGSWMPAGNYPGYSTAHCGNVRPISATISLRQG